MDPVNSNTRGFSSTEHFAYCVSVLHRGSKSFSAAYRLLPPRVRDDVAALYAFCRTADDEVDARDARGDAVSTLRARLDRVNARKPGPDPIERAFADVMRTHSIPPTIPSAMLEGFQWDLERRRYENLGELRAYAARVASTVGVMMTLVMGRRSPDTLARACDLGVAMQLTNIARDVGEDARSGRIYLPLEWLRAERIDPEAWLRAPRFGPALGRVIDRVLDEAARLYARADSGIVHLPRDCRLAIRAARSIYADIGRVVRTPGMDPVMHRAVTSRGRKLYLALRALGAQWRPAREDANASAPVLEEARFLVAAVDSVDIASGAA